jgi:hypothetical protein
MVVERAFYPNTFDDFYEIRHRVIQLKHRMLTRINQKPNRKIKALKKYLVLIKWSGDLKDTASNLKIKIIERNTTVHIEYYLFKTEYILVAVLEDLMRMPTVNHDEWNIWFKKVLSRNCEVIIPNIRTILKRCVFDKVLIKTSNNISRCSREVCFCSLLIAHNQTLNGYENPINHFGDLDRLSKTSNQ